MLPVWQRVVAPYLEARKVRVVGVVQEQHPERAQLYAQWRKLEWPLFVDSLNRVGIAVVPKVVGLDEAGIVRYESMTPDQVGAFVEAAYPPPKFSRMFGRAPLPDVDKLVSKARTRRTAALWRRTGDAYFLHGGTIGVNRAVESYQRALARDPADAVSHFRLGVVLRRRYETLMRHEGDAQAAIDHWQAALASNPNQYIWRRRIQQFGPRLSKPYNFYSWVKQARKEIKARGETPVELPVPPRGAEVAPPDRGGTQVQPAVAVNRDPEGRIQRDPRPFVKVETMVTPARVQPGGRVRAHVDLRLSGKPQPWWNNEADDLNVWIDLPHGITWGEGRLTYPNPKRPETREQRWIEFELTVDPEVPAGDLALPAYALYYVCEDKRGKCRYLRQDFTLPIHVDPDAPRIR